MSALKERYDKKEKIEEKIESQIPEPVVYEKETSPTVILTEVDAHIHERLKSQPKTIEAIEARDIDLENNKHQLSLPDDIERIFKKRGITGRWINKDKRMIDRAIDIRGWAIVNRVLFPELPKHYYSANGTVERGDAILGFMPKRKADALRAAPGIRSNERVKNLPIEKWKGGGESYYKPTLTEEKDGETLQAGIQPDTLKEE